LSVVVIERDEAPRGASVRNFGHGFLTAQAGDALDDAIAARQRWLRLARDADLWVRESGTLLLAQWPEELAVIAEFVESRNTGAELLEPTQALARAPVARERFVGALWTPLDLRVDPREAAPALASWLERDGVSFRWHTNVVGVESGLVSTNRGEIEADAIVVAIGHELDQLFPQLAEDAGVLRCVLQMLRVAPPAGLTVGPALATGLALLRYSALADCPLLETLRVQ